MKKARIKSVFTGVFLLVVLMLPAVLNPMVGLATSYSENTTNALKQADGNQESNKEIQNLKNVVMKKNEKSLGAKLNPVDSDRTKTLALADDNAKADAAKAEKENLAYGSLYMLRKKGNEAKDIVSPVLSELDLKSEGAESVTITIPTGLKYKDIEILTGWSEETSKDPQTRVFNTNGEHNTAEEVTEFVNSIQIEEGIAPNGSSVYFDDVKDSIEIKINNNTRSVVGRNGHYYEYIESDGGWFKSYNLAKRMRYRGLQGYLATITSADENRFLYNEVYQKSGNKQVGWLGGTRATIVDRTAIYPHHINNENEISTDPYDYNENTQFNVWYWACGPEVGKNFYSGSQHHNNVVGNPHPDWYDNWSGMEPNNGKNNQYYSKANAPYEDIYDPVKYEETALAFGMPDPNIITNGGLQGTKDSPNDRWHDKPTVVGSKLPFDPYYPKGAYVEYSGVPGSRVEPLPIKAAILKNVKLEHIDDKTGEKVAPDENVYWDETTGFKVGQTYDAQVNVDKVIAQNPKSSVASSSKALQGTYTNTTQNITIKYNWPDNAADFYLIRKKDNANRNTLHPFIANLKLGTGDASAVEIRLPAQLKCEKITPPASWTDTGSTGLTRKYTTNGKNNTVREVSDFIDSIEIAGDSPSVDFDTINDPVKIDITNQSGVTGPMEAGIPKNVALIHQNNATGAKLVPDEDASWDGVQGIRINQKYDAQKNVDRVSENNTKASVSSSSAPNSSVPLQGNYTDKKQNIAIKYEWPAATTTDFHIVRTKDDYHKKDVLRPSIDKLTLKSGRADSIQITFPAGLEFKDATIPSNWGWTTDNDPKKPLIHRYLTNGNYNDTARVQQAINSFQIGEDGKSSINMDDISDLIKIEINSVQGEMTEDDGHYYEFIGDSVSWMEAYNRAKKRTYNGLTGYLATITSQKENELLKKLSKGRPGWIGGTRMVKKDAPRINVAQINDESEISTVYSKYAGGDSADTNGAFFSTRWYWACGPEHDTWTQIGDKKNVFFNGILGPYGKPFNPKTYYNWTPYIAPNNAEGQGYGGNGVYSKYDRTQIRPSENCVQFPEPGTDGKWNDVPGDIGGGYPIDSKWIAGYYVEYSEYEGQTEKPPEPGSNFEYTAEAAIPKNVTLRHINNSTLAKVADDEIVHWNDTSGFEIEQGFSAENQVNQVLANNPKLTLVTPLSSLHGTYTANKQDMWARYEVKKQEQAQIKVEFKDVDGTDLRDSSNALYQYNLAAHVGDTVDLRAKSNSQITDILSQGYTLVTSPPSDTNFLVGSSNQTVTYVFKGDIEFVSVTKALHFENGQAFGTDQRLKGENDVDVVIKDYRSMNGNPLVPAEGIRGTFDVQASLTKPFTKVASTDKLTGAQLYYDTTNIGTTPITVKNSVQDSSNKGKKDFNFALEKGTTIGNGWYLHVPNGPKTASKYNAQITWTLKIGP